jgi:hypothetical protein
MIFTKPWLTIINSHQENGSKPQWSFFSSNIENEKLEAFDGNGKFRYC